MVQILIADLHENAAAGRQQFPGQQQPFAHIRQIAMQPEFPGVAVGLDHLRLAREIVIVVVLHVAFSDKRLEIAAELHAVGRVHVDHLHLAAEVLVVQKRVHHHQRIAEDHAVGPAVAELVGAQDLVGDRVLRIAEEAEERGLRFLGAAVPGQGLDDRLGREPLVNEQRERGDLEACPLGLARPIQERPREPLELVDGILEAGYRGQDLAVGALEVARCPHPLPLSRKERGASRPHPLPLSRKERGASCPHPLPLSRKERGGKRGCLLDLTEEPFAQFAGRVLAVPLQAGRERGVVAVRCGRLLLAELGLGADVGPQGQVGLRMLVALRIPPLALRERGRA